MDRSTTTNATAQAHRRRKASGPTGGACDALFELIKTTFQVKNDAALSRMLQVEPPAISKIRHGKVGVSAEMIIRIHEATGWSIADIKKKLGLPSLA